MGNEECDVTIGDVAGAAGFRGSIATGATDVGVGVGPMAAACSLVAGATLAILSSTISHQLRLMKQIQQ